jgi:tRNA pseudouridine55 synthase
MDGVLVIDKPVGPTSHDVVAVVRRVVRPDKVGHTGTLDPLATGVLPLVIGRATRLASYMSGAHKEYVAKIRFGIATDTYDAEGQDASAPATAESQAVVSGLREAAIVETLTDFRGRYFQTPPPFSAKKIGGTPAYKLARQRKTVEIGPVEVAVLELELRHYADGLAELRLVCSSGFYVRSFAHDLGRRLGCGAHLEALRRTRAGDFTLADAVPLEAVVVEGLPAVERRLVPMNRLLPELPGVVVSDPGVRRASHGRAIGPGDIVGGRGTADAGPAPWSTGGRLRLLDDAGSLIGLAEPRDDGLLHPVVVLV